jgi:hypothetical protein
MHGQIDAPYYKGPGGGSKTNDTGADNTVHNSGGTPGHSVPQRPIPGPESTGGPVSLKKALAPKSGSSVTGAGPGLPNRNTTAAGSVR